MKVSRKRLWLIIAICIVLLAVTGILARRYIPFSKLIKVSSTPESEIMAKDTVLMAAPHSYAYNFEVDPAKELPGGIYEGQAHSGKYSTKAFGKNSFSIAVEKTARDIGVDNLRGVGMGAWIYVMPGKNEVHGALVFTASNSVGVNLCWKGIHLDDPGVPRGKWFKMSGFSDLSDVKFQPDTRIQVYFWNNSDNDILMDDLYLAFGGEKQRKGDTTKVDLTKGPYVPAFNCPPYPVIWLAKKDISIPGELVRQTGISDRVFSGDFTGGQGMQQVLLISPEGNCRLVTYCREQKTTVLCPVKVPAEAGSLLKTMTILQGNFAGTGEQLLFIGPKAMMLATIESSPCKGASGEQAGMKILWQSDSPDFLMASPDKLTFVAGDFDGNRGTELLAVKENGSWSMFRFSGREWALVSADEDRPVKEWKKALVDIKLTAGRFAGPLNKDVILAVLSDREKHLGRYSIRVFKPEAKDFIAFFPDKQDGLGKIIGPDTLKPSDIYFFADINNDGKKEILRYNRDWRYDLKEIAFNDTACRFIANIDFTGYPKDQNPKYYESLEIVPCRFSDAGINEFFLITRNRKILSFLPDEIQVYSVIK